MKEFFSSTIVQVILGALVVLIIALLLVFVIRKQRENPNSLEDRILIEELKKRTRK